jgi:O-acetyl-ADP-ribose deacetylase (regulator of RNase III)
MELRLANGRTLKLVQGDITRLPADAICNAANSALAGGGGVDGAIHRAGGPSIMRELDRIREAQGGCPTGSAVATTAGRLPAKWVFHAVGPVYRDGKKGEAQLLASCYRTCLALAEERKAETISFPSISTGVYGYPLDQAAPVALAAVAEHLARAVSVREAIFVLFDPHTFKAYQDALGKMEANP